jgi:uncharacterized protein
MNHLDKETSPYLLQHANNPVDWYPWNAAALQKARQENKPILLSIGYAACHWCHVMARESFSDEQTAALMNQWFINIKVDREEHPDLDKIYQTAHQLLTGRAGGWPLTVFLTPDQQLPFYAGTYFPVEESLGRPGFKTVLTEVAHFYYQRSDAIQRTTKALQMALAKISTASSQGVAFNESPLLEARKELEEIFDFIHGGFGRAPKFPLTTHLNSLLEYAYFSTGKDPDALQMVNHTLTRMALGGLRDQLGGGFFRYCIDSHWMIPHFEKMLYDNAQLIAIYSDMILMQKDDLFKSAVLTTVDWALREMRALQGGFYASLNADTEGVEGRYYYWDRDEIRYLLSPLEYSAIEDYFGLNRPPNFEGHWHLFIAERDQSIQAQWLAVAQKKLLAAREQRVAPSADRKILTAWNALMIKALIKAAKALDRADWIEAAQQTVDFIKENLWMNETLLAVSTDGHAHLPAYLDDYAFLLDALLEFLQVRWRDDYCLWAIELAQQMLQRFYDAENGGFFYTAIDHEPLIQRMKIFSDESIPSGNGVAVFSLLRLGYLLGNSAYLAAAEKTLQAAWEQIDIRPSAHGSLLTGLRYYFDPPTHIILRGNPDEVIHWREAFSQYYLPDHQCYALTGDVSLLPASLQKPSPSTGVCAYICKGLECQAVIDNQSEFDNYLRDKFCSSI